MKRRTFLKDVGLVAGGLAASALVPDVAAGWGTPASNRAPESADVAAGRPNILVVIVDQLRFPQAPFTQAIQDRVATRLAELRAKSVSFEHHYAAANACSPSRSTMVTGLYTHQNGLFLTNVEGLAGQGSTPSLNTGFPTYGKILSSKDFGYNTYWWGKWHLTTRDATTAAWAKDYGFSDGGLPTPSPNGGPGQGQGVDPVTTQVFKNWLNQANALGPWCTTVSLVNPHDVEWFPKYTENQPGQSDPPPQPEFQSLVYNFERWPEAIAKENKPRLQQAWVLLCDAVFGFVPTNPGQTGYPELWHELLDLYYLVIGEVDKQIGAVIDAVNASSAANNTIIVFTSDHGEYGGAHGLRGKAFTTYEEAYRVPLYVYDPTGEFVPSGQAGTTRDAFTSAVDLVPLLMTLASGNNNWRANPNYAHLAGRADLVGLLKDPTAPGRDYVVYSSDEDIPYEAPKVGFAYKDVLVGRALNPNPPTHVIGYRTKEAKLGVYSYFVPGSIQIQMTDQQAELYDYVTFNDGEVTNSAPGGSQPNPALYAQMYTELFNATDGVVPTELRKPLPAYLQKAYQEAMAAYIAYELSLRDTAYQYIPYASKQ